MGICVALLCAIGCESERTAQRAYEGELKPEQVATLWLPSNLRLVSVDGKQYSGVTDDEAEEKSRAIFAGSQPDDAPAYPRRYIEIPVGKRELVVGLPKQMVPITRDTHIAVVFLSGQVTYSKKLYPGSAQNVVLRFNALPTREYGIVPKWSRQKGQPQTWTFKVYDRASEGDVPFEIVKTVPSELKGGTNLSPEEWAEQEKEALAK